MQCTKVIKQSLILLELLPFVHFHSGILSGEVSTIMLFVLDCQSPYSDYVTRCYFNLCLKQGSRDDRVSRDVFSFLCV